MLEIGNVRFGDGIPKICSSITEEDRKSVIASADIMVQRDVDFIEWRIDYFQDIDRPDVLEDTLRRLHNSLEGRPLLVTYRSVNEGGKGKKSQEEIEKFLMKAAGSPYVDMVDIEAFMGLDLQDELESLRNGDGVSPDKVSLIDQLKKDAYVVGSYHNFDSTPSMNDIEDIFRYIRALGCDILKAAFMPESNEDVLNLMHGVSHIHMEDPDIPVISISMGNIGVISRMACESYGCAASFASVGKASAPGQVDIDKLRDIISMLHTVRMPVRKITVHSDY
ncbi:MAG: type I 3-dehydroquinate dehydratase [Lachnospiraceae bacterium]|jgi:3-dehydroquinate dehydratase-1|nr:type I 3-dehydroquinate dehydratase [Lachnospiraceae bacterium]MEE3461012.1 type I 3-dehydroquinate dehydratase [Lachnospiraceae bacterium]